MYRSVLRLVVAVLVLATGTAEAFHYITPTLVQIPPVGVSPGTIHNPRWGGLRYVLFDSDADLLNNGSTGRHVYLFDLQLRDILGSPALSQLSIDPLADNQRGRTGRNAVKVVFDARPNGVGARQLVLYDRRTDTRTALTAGAGDSENAVVDDVERMVVFESSADFFATGVAGKQIYQIDLHRALIGCPFPCAQTGNEGLKQITNKVGTNRNAVTSNGGKVIAFESDADLLNVGQTENQVYLYDKKSQTTTLLSHGPGAGRHPTMTRDGGRIIFESDANLTGSGTGGTQLFLHHRTKSTLTQLTFPPGGACTNPSISSNGHAVAFLSADDLLGLGSAGPEVYSYQLKKNYLAQLTNAPAIVAEPAYASGVFTVFLANGDLAGNGSPGTELYLVNLYALGGSHIP